MDNFNYNRLDNNRLTFPRAIFCLRNLLWFLVAVFFVWVVVKAQENVVPWDEADMILVNDTTISPIFREFYKCVKPKLAPLKGNYQNFWYDFTNVISECDSLEAYTALDIRPSRNRDEIKYVAFPRKNENLTMVTLGIGHDVSAEIRLRELYPNIQFFGADPSSEINKNLYEKSLGGKYFQYAVSDQNGIDDSVVLGNDGYVQQKTQHIGIDHFFKNIVQKSKIDILWMDIEGNEYPVLNQLHHDGNLDRQGVKICQLNVEMHKDLSNLQEMKLFHNFIWKVLEDRKYIFMKPVFVKWQQFRFIRLFIVNIADQECTDLYVK